MSLERLPGVGEGKGFRAGNYLQRGARSARFIPVDGRNEGNRVRSRLLLEVPALEIAAPCAGPVIRFHLSTPFIPSFCRPGEIHPAGRDCWPRFPLNRLVLPVNEARKRPFPRFPGNGGEACRTILPVADTLFALALVYFWHHWGMKGR